MSLQLADVPHGSSHVSAVGGILASVSELRPAAVSDGRKPAGRDVASGAAGENDTFRE